MTRNELLDALRALGACDRSLVYVQNLDPFTPAELWDGGRILPGWYAWLICNTLSGRTVLPLAEALVSDCEARYGAGRHDRLGLARAQYACERLRKREGEGLLLAWPVLEDVFLGVLPMTWTLRSHGGFLDGQIAALRAHAPWAEIERAIPVAVAMLDERRAHEPA